MSLISLVVPCFNEEDCILPFQSAVDSVYDEMRTKYRDTGDPIEFEVIYVDDGSTDRTLETIIELSSKDQKAGMILKYISLSKNFGKESAMLAGLDASNGDYVATMDVDLQDPPSLLPEMYGLLIDSDADNVATRRVTRKGEPRIRSLCARMFYRLMNRLSDTEIVDGSRDYRLMDRRMVNAICSLREYNRFSKGIFGWVGFKTEWIEYENVERASGETKWGFFSLLSYSIEGIVAFSTKPLNIAAGGGILFCLLALIVLIFIIVRTILFGDPVAGWPSLVCLIMFIGGAQMLSLGIFGRYLAHTYNESKRRPIYIVRSTNIE